MQRSYLHKMRGFNTYKKVHVSQGALTAIIVLVLETFDKFDCRPYTMRDV